MQVLLNSLVLLLCLFLSVFFISLGSYAGMVYGAGMAVFSIGALSLVVIEFLYGGKV